MAKDDLSMDDFMQQYSMQPSSGESSEAMQTTDEFKKLSIHPNDEASTSKPSFLF